MPIMATSFIQMAYSLTDMAWVGRLGSESVAVIGAVGILTWMSSAIALLNKVGAEVSVAQAIGARDTESARAFATHNITIALIISILWGGALFLFATPIMELFRLAPNITCGAASYLRIVSTALPFIFLTAAMTGISTSSSTPSPSLCSDSAPTVPPSPHGLAKPWCAPSSSIASSAATTCWAD
jgi:Na+-driven multidrug efflux pump